MEHEITSRVNQSFKNVSVYGYETTQIVNVLADGHNVIIKLKGSKADTVKTVQFMSAKKCRYDPKALDIIVIKQRDRPLFIAADSLGQYRGIRIKNYWYIFVIPDAGSIMTTVSVIPDTAASTQKQVSGLVKYDELKYGSIDSAADYCECIFGY